MKAALFREAHKPLTIEDLEVDEPRGREVLVRTVATGVCHSDLHIVEGVSWRRLEAEAVVMGHEGAGVVEKVGPDVTTLRPGDHVVACLSGFCGTCEMCLSGHPNVCLSKPVARPRSGPSRMSVNGKPVDIFNDIGSFAEQMLLHENSLVRIDPDLPLDKAALVGCGVLTGAGASLRTAGMSPGETVAVFGCGGVGLSAIQGARIRGARQIIAVDQFDNKLEMAKQVGATHVVNGAQTNAVDAIRSLTGGAGVNHAIEAVGNKTLVRQAVESLAVRGTATIVGVLPAGEIIEFPWMSLRPECKVQTSRMGSNQFRKDIPVLLEFYRQGRLKLDEMVTAHRQLEDVNDAFRAMKAGEVARTVLMFE